MFIIIRCHNSLTKEGCVFPRWKLSLFDFLISAFDKNVKITLGCLKCIHEKIFHIDIFLLILKILVNAGKFENFFFHNKSVPLDHEIFKGSTGLVTPYNKVSS
jgi:hypothetical protein